jgi:hypothetical protein
MDKHMESVEQLLRESLDPRALRQRCGLPHPLSKFAANGEVEDNVYANVVLTFLHSWTLEEPGTGMHRAAEWFLFESEQAFFLCCSECGIDAEKLRNHLQLCE